MRRAPGRRETNGTHGAMKASSLLMSERGANALANEMSNREFRPISHSPFDASSMAPTSREGVRSNEPASAHTYVITTTTKGGESS